jgi:hypothetical protein
MKVHFACACERGGEALPATALLGGRPQAIAASDGLCRGGRLEPVVGGRRQYRVAHGRRDGGEHQR